MVINNENVTTFKSTTQISFQRDLQCFSNTTCIWHWSNAAHVKHPAMESSFNQVFYFCHWSLDWSSRSSSNFVLAWHYLLSVIVYSGITTETFGMACQPAPLIDIDGAGCTSEGRDRSVEEAGLWTIDFPLSLFSIPPAACLPPLHIPVLFPPLNTETLFQHTSSRFFFFFFDANSRILQSPQHSIVLM